LGKPNTNKETQSRTGRKKEGPQTFAKSKESKYVDLEELYRKE